MNSNKRTGRPSGSSSFRKPSRKFSGAKAKSKSEANAAGYEKRLARKGKKPSNGDLNDLYEHVETKQRRSRVTLDLDRDEEFDYAVGLDNKTAEEREELRARLIGENQDDEEIASEDDEEIDSDAAFEESDEERFAGFFSSKKNKSKTSQNQKGKSTVRFAEVDLNEDEDMDSDDGGKHSAIGSESEEEEEEEEGDDDEFIDLLDVLDGKGDIDMGSDDESKQPAASTSKIVKNDEEEGMEEDENSEEEDDGGDDDDDEEEDEQMDIAPSDDEDTPGALDQLHDFVSGLDVSAKKRKAPEDETNEISNAEPRTARKRRLITKEKTEAGEENEFRAHASGSKLNLDDLLAPLGAQSSTLQSLKKSTKVLDPSASSSSSKTKAKKLSAPLPQRIQERLDRQAAYEQTKEEVDKWTETMKRIREAEHLSFPLQAEGKAKASNLELNAKFKPTTEMESAVDALLRSAKMREEDIQNTEDTMLKMNNLSVEEVAERRAELRKMRELMFRAEIKARRVKKIKSKTYRKIKRKEKERLGEKIDEDLDSGEDGEAGRLKAEMDRARERATLRHKHTGKWATRMRGKEGLSEESRRDIEDMLARGEKLRRRIKGVGSDEDDSEEESSDEDDGLDAEAGLEKIKEGAFNELRQLEDDDEEDDGEGKGKKGKSVFEMKFMKDAMARKALEANREVDDFIKEMGGTVHREGEDSDAEQEEMQELDPTSGVLTQRTGGRLTFRPPTATNHQSQPRTLATFSDTSSVTLKSTDLQSPPPASPTVTKISELSKPQEQVNPWLVPDASNPNSSRPKPAKKANEVVVSKDSKFAEKSKARLKKSAQKKADEREKAADDAVVEISMDAVMTASTSTSTVPAPSASSSKKTKAVPTNAKAGVTQKAAADSEDSDDDVNVELEAQEQALAMKGKGRANGVTAFEQRDLVALAFAGDNVVQNFEEAKQREIASDAPREVDTTIPGWGSWGGTGLKKAPPKPQRIKKIAGIDPTTRADYNKKNIIISEKRDKKAGKYLVKDLPYPYTSKAQFERAMERPLGAEWNTRVGFQRGTLPKVVKKPGIIISPLEKQHA